MLTLDKWCNGVEQDLVVEHRAQSKVTSPPNSPLHHHGTKTASSHQGRLHNQLKY